MKLKQFFKKLFKRKMTLVFLIIVVIMMIAGILAPVIAPHDPLEQNLVMKFSMPSLEYPMGTDNLGRCIFSRRRQL